jgi:hypothetical protein
MSKPADEFEASRTIVETLKEFKQPEQQMIFRWAAERLGLPQPFGAGSATHVVPPRATSPLSAAPAASATHAAAPSVQDIKSFVAAKNPRSDVQFAATVAYYFQFEAPPSERKEAINKDDLQDACRKVGRERFKNPYGTLANAHTLGLLDKGPEKATYSINSVGENLVAMTLPGEGDPGGKPSKKRATKKGAKTPRKPTASGTSKKA